MAYFFGTGLAQNWDSVREIDVRVNEWSVGAVVLFTAGVALSGVLWGRMVSTLAGTRVPVADAVRVQCASWLLKYVPGQVGSLANKVAWAGRHGISRTLVVITFVYENVFLLLGSIVPSAVILVLSVTWGTDSSDALEAVLPALVALVPLLLLTDRRVFRRVVDVISRRALKRPVPPEHFLDPRAAVGYQVAFLGPRVLNGVGFVMVAVSFLDVPPSAYVPLAATYVLAGAVGILAVFVPSGLGVRESVVVLLASLWLPVEQAIVLSLLARLYSTVSDAAVALVYALLQVRHVKGARTS